MLFVLCLCLYGISTVVFEIFQSQYLGMLVYDAHAEDNDTGITGIVDYSFLVPGQGYVQQTPAFGINPVTGVIRAEKVYDREGPEPRYVVSKKIINLARFKN